MAGRSVEIDDVGIPLGRTNNAQLVAHLRCITIVLYLSITNSESLPQFTCFQALYTYLQSDHSNLQKI